MQERQVPVGRRPWLYVPYVPRCPLASERQFIWCQLRRWGPSVVMLHYYYRALVLLLGLS